MTAGTISVACRRSPHWILQYIASKEVQLGILLSLTSVGQAFYTGWVGVRHNDT